MEEIEKRIIRARPVSGNRNLPLSDRAKRELAELLIADSRTAPTKKPQRSWFNRPQLLALAATILVAIGITILWPSHVAPAAATPPPLEVQPLSASAQDPLPGLILAAAQTEGTPPVPGGDVRIRLQSWVFHLEEVEGEEPAGANLIVPEEREIIRRADGSMSTRVTVGQAYDRTGEPAPDSPDTGSEVWTLNQSPDEYQPLFTSPAPSEAADVGEFLAVGSGLDVESSASNTFNALSYLLMEQRLDGPQTAAILEFISNLPDVKIEGTTLDRLDRPAYLLSSQRPDGENSDYLLIDRESGAILAFETVYTGTSRTDLTAGAVTEYHVWENNE